MEGKDIGGEGHWRGMTLEGNDIGWEMALEWKDIREDWVSSRKRWVMSDDGCKLADD